jgi:hypothetical protein
VPLRLRPYTSASVAAATLALTLPAAPAVYASTLPDHELPFVCGEQWTGTTRSQHSPSPLAVDFNRPGDLGALAVSSAPGYVSRVEDAGDRSYGKWVLVDHGGGYSSLYAHLLVQWVVPGQAVDAGAPLGRVGDTGGVSGAHLHFEQRSGGSVQHPVFGGASYLFGSTTASANCPDVPLAGDWDGDGTDDVGVFRRRGSGVFVRHTVQGDSRIVLGRGSDAPVTGDWDGDGVDEVGVRRQGSRTFHLRHADGSVISRQLGLVRDVPVTGDWDGDGDSDLGVWRPGAGRFRLLQADGTQRVVALGTAGSQPLTGDWNGDGVTDVGVYDAITKTFTLRSTGANGTSVTSGVVFGSGSDLPVTGDWNGDGVTDLGTWTPTTATFTLRFGTTVRARVETLTFGNPR